MKIQQAIIVIMLTAIICVFVGLLSENVGVEDTLKPLYRSVIFGFVILFWLSLVTISDLYMSVGTLRNNMNSYMACTNKTSSSSSKTTVM